MPLWHALQRRVMRATEPVAELLARRFVFLGTQIVGYLLLIGAHARVEWFADGKVDTAVT
jgi:hypothetical protein